MVELNINTSETMTKNQRLLQEKQLLRIPKVCREIYNLHIGEFVFLRNRLGGVETFQIDEAFKEDIVANTLCGYVTNQTYNRLFLKNRGASTLQRVTDITLGCDPEVFLVSRDTQNIVAAYRFVRKAGDVGNDGLLLEFRPEPSTRAEDVCHNLWTLIRKARQILNQFREGNTIMIRGGSGYQNITAGFHLHYGLPRGLLAGRQDTHRTAALMTAVFDYYVGVPSIIPEGNTDADRRTTKYMNYGKPGGFNLNNKTFEFRLPGGVNMKHPLLAGGLMALGAVVAEDVVSRVNTCTDGFSKLKEVTREENLRCLYPNLPDVQDFYGIICNPDISAARNHYEKIKSEVRTMVGYKERAQAVEQYFECLDKNIQFSYDIERNWGEFYNAEQ